ncbi:MAG: hypothetical protein CMP58_02430 [Flavobacteriales bacterium]|nr:hypothetical protein [Flavobacteriales bacterium]
MTTHIFPFIKKIKLIFQSPPELIYIPKSFLYILLILLQTPFHWIELILYKKKIKSHKIKHPPVIILGYWRSGTTYLQRILTVNKKTTYLSLYESILPLGSIIHSIFLEKIMNFIFKKIKIKHPLHRTNLDTKFPSEEDIALCCSAYEHTPMWAHVYSKKAKYFFNKYLICEKESKEYSMFKKMYSYLVKKISFQNPNKTIILKSPCNTSKIKEIMEIFPNAKFIYISRNINDVYYSNMKLLKTNKTQWLQKMDEKERDELFIYSYNKMMNYYNKNKHIIPKDNLIEIKFEEFFKRPEYFIEQINSKFKIPYSKEDEKRYKQFILKYHGKNRYKYKKQLPKNIKEKIK